MKLKQKIMRNPFSFWHLLLRSLLPSSASLIVSTVITFIVVGLQILLLSLKQGTFMPQLFGDASSNWTDAYSRFIIDPVESFTTNNTVNTVLLGMLWGLVGWALFLIVMSIASTAHDVRENRDSVYVPSPQRIVQHPLQNTLIMRLVWRAGIIVLAVVVTVLFAPVVSDILERIESGSYATSPLTLATNIAVIYFGWMGVMHAYIVLLRLFLFRTRVRGEIVDNHTL